MDTSFEEIILLDSANLEGIRDSEKLEKYRKKYSEPLDVVNDDGKIIGKASRGFIHKCGLRHRTVHVLIYDSKGEFLLQTRGAGADRIPGRLDIAVGGHVKSGENNFKESALRELCEELGIQCAPNRLRLISEYNRDSQIDITKPHVRNRERRLLYIYKVTDYEHNILNSIFANRSSGDEVVGLDWFDIDMVVQLIHLGRVADGLRGSFLEFLRWIYKEKNIRVDEH